MMLAFVIGSKDPAAWNQTVQYISKALPDCEVITLDSSIGSIGTGLNTALIDYEQPFFLTLYAGECLLPKFRHEMEQWLQNIADHEAGIVLDSTEDFRNFHRNHKYRTPRGPVIWRTEALRSGATTGFSDLNRLPFDSYVLIEKQYQLSPFWSWKMVQTAAWSPRIREHWPWEKKEQEWTYLSPILQAQHASPVKSKNSVISVVICTYNNASYLPWAINSVRVQTNPIWELIIVNDGSTDETQSMLELLAARSKDERISVLNLEHNQGKSGCLNRALSLASGQWLLELDADDWLTPDCLEILLDSVSAPGNPVFVYADHIEWLERPDRRLLFHQVRIAPQVSHPGKLLADAIPLAPRMYRIAALKEAGGWTLSDPFSGRLYEDLYMLARLLEAGTASHISKPLYHRRLRKASMSHRHQDDYESWVSWYKAAYPPFQ
ncbi:glycosyltransferase family 2 protein [Paenibacillus sp. GCM10027628]|uniref:glycosyltransferase family 2 protein n=1 Tax=Paenibacillus sp. GCM10027628 TaxID=3273413 RepID=UPI0036254A9A